MVQVSLCKDHRIDFATFEAVLAPVLCTLLFSTLKKAAIHQNARLIRNHVIGRSGHITRCAMKMNPHRSSPAQLDGPLPLAYIGPVDTKCVCILPAGNLHVSKLLLRVCAD